MFRFETGRVLSIQKQWSRNPEVVGLNPTWSKKLIFQILIVLKNCKEILISNKENQLK